MRQILSILTFSIMLCKVGYAVTYDTHTNFIVNGDAENSVDFSGWYHSASATEVSDNGPLGAGSQCFNVPNGDNLRTQSIAVSGGTYHRCKFNYKSTVGTTGWIWGLLRYFNASGQFITQNTLQLQTTGGEWKEAVISDSLSPVSATTADIAFFGDGVQMNSYSDSFRFDNIYIWTQGGLEAEPFHQASNVNMYTTLSWESEVAAAAYDLYLGTNENAISAASRTSPEFVETIDNMTVKIKYAVNLRPHTSYYWRVDRVTVDGNISAGSVAHFNLKRNALG